MPHDPRVALGPHPPWMDDYHVEIISSKLRSYDHPISVVEWGVGRSTIYWCEGLFRDFVDFDWLAIDNKPEYVERASQLKSPDWPLRLVLATDKDSYVNMPMGKIDVAIIDGRWRSDCITFARSRLKGDGVIFLHDAQREKYQAACDGLVGQKFMGRQGELRAMWVDDE